MAKFETHLHGNLDTLLQRIDQGILSGSVSASREDGSDYQNATVRVAVRVYERYSVMGSNRLSLNITIIEDGQDLFVSAITSGGSQAMFFKINTFGEGTFLNKAVDIIEAYRNGR